MTLLWSLRWNIHVIRLGTRLFAPIIVHPNLLLCIVIANTLLWDFLELSFSRSALLRWPRWDLFTRRRFSNGTLCSWTWLRMSRDLLLFAMRLLLALAAVAGSRSISGLGAAFAASKAKLRNWIFVCCGIYYHFRFYKLPSSIATRALVMRARSIATTMASVLASTAGPNER